MKFTEDRRRSVAGTIISGKIVDTRDEKLPQPTVHYETAGKRWHEDKETREAEVNWSAMGPQPLSVARDYANQILAACDAAEVGARDFEPHDEVVSPKLPEGHVGVVREVGERWVKFEHGIPGEPDTWKLMTLALVDSDVFVGVEVYGLRRANAGTS